MNLLNPKQLLDAQGLRVTEAEKQEIFQRLHPPNEEGIRYADAIFEGGGVRGIAFLGALRCCHDLGLRWKKLAGTSAGAITAALLAADVNIDWLEKILGELDYMQFLTRKTSPLILNGDPRNDLQLPLQMIASLIVARQLGQYSSDPFRDWVGQVLNQNQVTTFADLRRMNRDRMLKVVVSDISHGEMLVLPDDLNPNFAVSDTERESRQKILQMFNIDHHEDFNIAEAVRLSMSIPLFFEPGKLGDRVIVDGGILSNFPLWIYDISARFSVPPRYPTFGFRLLDRSQNQEQPIRGPLDVFGATFRTMMKARDSYHMRDIDRGRVINIDVTDANVTPTQFNIRDAAKIKLYQLGYEQTKAFFLRRWNWLDHLRRRGFEPEEQKIL